MLKIYEVIKDLLFPRRCAMCDDLLSFGEKGVCPQCREKMVYIEEPFCMKCGKALKSEEEYCKDCRSRVHHYIQGCGVFDYGCMAPSLYRFKNKNRREYASFYAEEIVKRKGQWLKALNADALVPVPIHSRRLKKRGYNQSEILSKELSELTQIPTRSDLILRTKNTIPLKSMTLRQRQNNLKKAFKVRNNDVKLKTIVIIDDIYTTGSTIDSMTQVLEKAYGCKVYFITLAIGRGV